MKKLLNLFFLFTLFITFSQDVSVSLESNSITEAQSTKITASLSATSDKDVFIDFGPVSGTALNYLDYNVSFITKLLQTTVAGGNNSGSSLDQLNDPMDIAIDSDGNIYVVEINNHRVTKWVPGATQGIVVAGGNDSGNALNQLNSPHGITIDSNNNLYIYFCIFLRSFMNFCPDFATNSRKE